MSQSLIIEKISLSYGSAGTKVTLTGTGFGLASFVGISGSGYKNSLTPQKISSSSITFKIPSELSPGVYRIRVVGSEVQTHGTMQTSNYIEFNVIPGI